MRRLPHGAVDCHCHVFGPTQRNPLAPERRYDPAPAPIEACIAADHALGFERMVLVQSSAYSADNSCLLDAIGIVGVGRCRGVVTLDEDTGDDALVAMTQHGVRAARLNFVHGAELPSLASLQRLAARIAPHGWHLEIFALSAFIERFVEIVPVLPVDIVLDHMGSLPPEPGPAKPALERIRSFLATGRGWIKLSAYRNSLAGPPFADVAEGVRSAAFEFPQRCVFGTDWPHLNAPHPVTSESAIDLLLNWIDRDEALMERILVRNPEALYGFATSSGGLSEGSPSHRSSDQHLARPRRPS